MNTHHPCPPRGAGGACQKKPISKQAKKDLEKGAIVSITLGDIAITTVNCLGQEETLRFRERFYELSLEEKSWILRLLTQKPEAQPNQLKAREQELPLNARSVAY